MVYSLPFWGLWEPLSSLIYPGRSMRARCCASKVDVWVAAQSAPSKDCGRLGFAILVQSQVGTQ
jgi:hypothetical protein